MLRFRNNVDGGRCAAVSMRRVAGRVLCAALTLASMVPLYAQEQEDEFILPSAEVTAKREIVNEVTQEQMEERGSTTLMEAIRWIPGVTTSGGHPGYGN